jgi:hypothetical protein
VTPPPRATRPGSTSSAPKRRPGFTAIKSRIANYESLKRTKPKAPSTPKSTPHCRCG